MSIEGAYTRLRSELHGDVRRDEPMARHTTYRIGGPAALYVQADEISDISHALRILADESVEYTVLGKGSNVLVSDTGFQGAVLSLGRDFKRHECVDGFIKVGAGAILAHVVQDAFARGLAGMEFAVGIPGTLGGALAMNAGSRDRWIGSIVDSLTLYVPGQGLVGVRGSEVPWAYRRSGLVDRGVIIECTLRVSDGDRDAIRRSMEASFRRRKETQPVGTASAGSVFVNPPGESAGRLIEEAGLKGARVGGAEVSQIHANFIVNTGGATAADVVALIRMVRSSVKDSYGIELRPEIRFLGSFDDA